MLHHPSVNLGIAKPQRFGTSSRPDGRRLAWAEWGPPDGVPMLLCPGAATSRSLGFGTHLVDAWGIRLVSVDRPGLGNSGAAPGRTLNDWAEDVGHLSRQRDLDGLSVVGFSAGAPFALACAAAGITSAVAIVSGGDELPHFAEVLPVELRELVRSVETDPIGSEALFARFASPEMLWNMITTGLSDVDSAVYRNPSFEPALRAAMSESLAPGPGGYARDSVLGMGRWPFELGDIAVPVDLWYGQQDTSPFHSPDHGQTLTTRIPTARRHLILDAGGSLLWTHAEPILRTLLRHSGHAH